MKDLWARLRHRGYLAELQLLLTVGLAGGAATAGVTLYRPSPANRSP
ncbi:hypothetical protein [Krasilnikovia sp. MM14-A1259]